MPPSGAAAAATKRGLAASIWRGKPDGKRGERGGEREREREERERGTVTKNSREGEMDFTLSGVVGRNETTDFRLSLGNRKKSHSVIS